MILQRDREVAIWGESDSSVKITIDDICVKGEAINGTFSVKIPQHICGGPYVLKIENETDCISINDVYYGDVYLASGQSNMYLSIADTNQKLDECENIVRIFTPDREWEYDRRPADMRWADICMENKESISAAASHFAVDISKTYNVPVGILNCNQGASCVCSWVAPESIEGEYAFTDEAKGGDWAYSLVFNQNSYHYNLWLKIIAPYTIRGVLWYQGESDAVKNVCDNYSRIFLTMVQDFRKLWDDPDLPFITVQLPVLADAIYWPVIRDQQTKAMLEGHNIGMITTGDCGELQDIHPKDKITVGKRLALYARGMIYGDDITHKPPMCVIAELEGDTVTLKFDNVADGLYEREPLCFKVTAQDGTQHDAEYEISGDTVRVHADGIIPTEVSFGYKWDEFVHLYSSVGLPAVPFKITI